MWRCPRCKANIRIFDVRTIIVAYPNGAEVDGDLQWNDENDAECLSCKWQGSAGEAWDEAVLDRRTSS